MSLPTSDSAWRIIRRTYAQAPMRARVAARITLAAGLAMVALQIAVDFSGPSSLEIAELASVILSTAGIVLAALGHFLHAASQRYERNEAPAFEPRIFTQMLIALPVIGVVSASLLSAAIGVLIVRGLITEPVFFGMAAVYAAFLPFIMRMVTRTTRFLWKHARVQAAAAAEARTQAAEAELAALQAQMNPHFLFNTLNTVAALVPRDPTAAERTIEHLAGVLRRTLDRSRSPLSTVSDEVDYARAYLAIEQQRLDGRLHVEWNIDPRLGNARVPTMTLQPLIENALAYAVNASIEGGRIGVTVEPSSAGLRVTVEDDGPGFPVQWREGTGLGNLRRRLATLYGDDAALRIASTDRGASVTVAVPADAGRTMSTPE